MNLTLHASNRRLRQIHPSSIHLHKRKKKNTDQILTQNYFPSSTFPSEDRNKRSVGTRSSNLKGGTTLSAAKSTAVSALSGSDRRRKSILFHRSRKVGFGRAESGPPPVALALASTAADRAKHQLRPWTGKTRMRALIERRLVPSTLPPKSLLSPSKFK